MIISHDYSLKREEPELYQLYPSSENMSSANFISSTILFPQISCNFRVHFLHSTEQLIRARVIIAGKMFYVKENLFLFVIQLLSAIRRYTVIMSQK